MKKGCEVPRCIHCGFQISRNPRGLHSYIHYPVRTGELKGSRFYHCLHYVSGLKTYATPPPTEGEV
jgi:hypothetical protein